MSQSSPEQPTSLPKRAQLFVTCLVDNFFPDVGFAVVKILEDLGLAVEFPQAQTCCGQPAFNGGLWDDARAMARHTINVLSQSDAPIVVPSGSCAEMLIHHYPEILAGDMTYATQAKEVAQRTYEISQFLVDILGVADLQAHASGCLTYHASCHGLRGLGLSEQPRQLLGHVKGIELKELPEAEACCGFGGLFAVKMGNISGAILQRKLDNIEATGADTIVGGDVSCLMHIAGGLRRRGSRVRVKHLAEVLVEGRGAGHALSLSKGEQGGRRE
ncbi:MAG: (Fe-S)-binding protein [Chloroflexi bacterium]|nr:(Fe-S)-binding protein [Chloroflexota bacterium]